MSGRVLEEGGIMIKIMRFEFIIKQNLTSNNVCFISVPSTHVISRKTRSGMADVPICRNISSTKSFFLRNSKT